MPDADARAFPTPRAWEKVSRIVSAPDSVRATLVAAIVGDAAAGEFEGFFRIWRSLPPIADIVANPDGAPVPVEPSTQYAVSIALARYSTALNFSAVHRYLARLPREMGILATMEATRRLPALRATAAFIAWATLNQDVTL
jgi:hypothetical protein